MGVDYRDKVLEFIRVKGPVLPVQVAKEMSTNILMASAMLSELSSKEKIKVSRLKVGGSPLYFLPGQEAMLLNFLQSLNEKDRRTVEELQRQRVMRDIEQDALTRVSLRGIKDFAHPLNVTHDGSTEIFWKWHALPDQDASGMIKSMLLAQAPPVPAPAPVASQQTVFAPSPVAQQAPLPIAPVAASVAPPAPQTTPAPLKVKPKRPKVSKPRPMSQPYLLQPQAPLPVIPQPPQMTLEDPALSDPFYKDLQTWAAKGNIKILEHTIVKKRQDYDLVLEIPSPAGRLVYYAKARNKQKLNDADLSSAFMQGQLKKLPAMLIAPGELSKRGHELLAKELRGLAFTRLA